MYCRIGGSSSHTWFVLEHLLGYPNVRNYDDSWTEWKNLVRRRSRSEAKTSRRLGRWPDPSESGNPIEHPIFGKDLPLPCFQRGCGVNRVAWTHRQRSIEVCRTAQHGSIDSEPRDVREL
jgi:hypothetical protein